MHSQILIVVLVLRVSFATVHCKRSTKLRLEFEIELHHKRIVLYHPINPTWVGNNGNISRLSRLQFAFANEAYNPYIVRIDPPDSENRHLHRMRCTALLYICMRVCVKVCRRVCFKVSTGVQAYRHTNAHNTPTHSLKVDVPEVRGSDDPAQTSRTPRF